MKIKGGRKWSFKRPGLLTFRAMYVIVTIEEGLAGHERNRETTVAERRKQNQTVCERELAYTGSVRMQQFVFRDPINSFMACQL